MCKGYKLVLRLQLKYQTSIALQVNDVIFSEIINGLISALHFTSFKIVTFASKYVGQVEIQLTY